MAIEIRNLTSELEAHHKMQLVGYAATYEQLSDPLPGGFVEKIAPTAFDRALREKQDVRALADHDVNKVLGRVANNTLQLSTDSRGLKFRVQLDPNQQAHRDLYAAVKRHDIDECSFAFSPNGANGDSFEDVRMSNGDWQIIRTLRDVNLYDVSIVSKGAYPNTAVAARKSTITDQTEIRAHIERWNKAHPNLRAVQALLKANYPLTVEALDHAYRSRRPQELTDALNLMRGVAYGEKLLRESGAGVYGVGGPRADLIGSGMPDSGASGVGGRQNLGQNEDPQFTLRVKSRLGHQRASAYHRDAAGKATDSMSRIRHDVAANAHADAAYCWPDSEKSQRARNASADCFPAEMVS